MLGGEIQTNSAPCVVATLCRTAAITPIMGGPVPVNAQGGGLALTDARGAMRRLLWDQPGVPAVPSAKWRFGDRAVGPHDDGKTGAPVAFRLPPFFPSRMLPR